MATIIDVAEVAGVSKSTVSRVVSGNGYVSQESRKKVLAAMDQLSYVPNALARHLQSGATKSIAFIAQNYFDMLGVYLESFINIARQYGYYVNVYFTDGDCQKERLALDQLKYKQVDGVFIMTRSNTWSVIESYSCYGPVSTWHRYDSPFIYSAYIDHYKGYYDSLDYLWEKGYRQIAHVLGRPQNGNTKARMQAIRDFYATHNWQIDERWLLLDGRNGTDLANQWHESDQKIEVFTFFTDRVAAEFLSQVLYLGYRVPENIAVMGFDNSKVSSLMRLTTVDYALPKQARNSFIYLFNQLNASDQLSFEPLSFNIVSRETTK